MRRRQSLEERPIEQEEGMGDKLKVTKMKVIN